MVAWLHRAEELLSSVGAADRRVLEEALAWSDAALIGAGTLREPIAPVV